MAFIFNKARKCTIKYIPGKAGRVNNPYSLDVIGFTSRLTMLHVNTTIAAITSDCKLSFIMERMSAKKTTESIAICKRHRIPSQNMVFHDRLLIA